MNIDKIKIYTLLTFFVLACCFTKVYGQICFKLNGIPLWVKNASEEIEPTKVTRIGVGLYGNQRNWFQFEDTTIFIMSTKENFHCSRYPETDYYSCITSDSTLKSVEFSLAREVDGDTIILSRVWFIVNRVPPPIILMNAKPLSELDKKPIDIKADSLFNRTVFFAVEAKLYKGNHPYMGFHYFIKSFDIYVGKKKVTSATRPQLGYLDAGIQKKIVNKKIILKNFVVESYSEIFRLEEEITFKIR